MKKILVSLSFLFLLILGCPNQDACADEVGDILAPTIGGAALGGIFGGRRGASIGAGVGFGVGAINASRNRERRRCCRRSYREYERGYVYDEYGNLIEVEYVPVARRVRRSYWRD